MNNLPGCIRLTERQVEAVIKLLPEYAEEWKEGTAHSLRVSGTASIAYAGDLKALPDVRIIDMTLMSGEEWVCLLSPLAEEEILLHIDRRIYRGGNGENLSDLEIFVYALESRPEVEAALYNRIASGYLARLIDDLGAYCPPDECARFIRSALEAGPIGAAWKAQEAARRIQSSIEDEMPEKRASSVIRKAGF